MTHGLRWASGLCLFASFVWTAVDPLNEGDHWNERSWVLLVLLVLFVGAVALFARVLCRESRLLRRNPDLLVPYGFLTFLLTALWPILTLDGMEWANETIVEIQLLVVHSTITPCLLLLIVLCTLYLSWVTLLVWRAAREETVDAGAEFGTGLRRFPAALAVGAFGTVLFLLLMDPLLSVIQELMADTGPWIVLFLFPSGLAWNLLTAPLVLEVFSGRRRFGPAFGAGLRAGVTDFTKWAWPVTFQLVLLGGLWFVAYSYTARETVVERSGNTTRTTTRTTTNSGVSYGSHVAWTGGYENDTEWDDEAAENWKAVPVPAVSFLLSLLLAALAILVKLRIAGRLEPPAVP